MTALWDSADLAGIGHVTAPFGATGVSIDTRTLAAGDLFIALVGERDGHAHVAEALERGAAAAMVHRAESVPAGAAALVVDDTLRALHRLGEAGRARFGGRMVAVTGSVGKTTTKEMLRAALGEFGAVHAAEASYNNHWGVPLTLARLPAGAAFCVCEIGMNNPGEIEPLARMVQPDVAVITNVEAAHIGHLGSLEAIADEKAAILRGLRAGGTAVLPADSGQFSRLRALAGEALTFGRAAWADVRVDGDDVVVAGRRLALPLSAPGAHLRVNAAAAVAAVVALGLDAAVAVEGLAQFRPLGGRGLQRNLGAVTLLDESYNANSASMRASLAVLRGMAGTRHIAVLGDMLELGAFGPAEHANLAGDVAETADLLYACGPLMRHLFEAVPASQRGALANDSASLAPIVADAVRPGDAVLIKGSLGSRMRLVVAGLEARLVGTAIHAPTEDGRNDRGLLEGST